MKKVIVCAALLSSAVGIVACGDDVTVVQTAPPGNDAGPDVTVADAGIDVVEPVDASDASDADAQGDAEVRDRLLLSYNGATTSELVVFDIADKNVAGRLTYPGFIGTTSAQGSAPFLLEQSADIVARLDPIEPWIVRSTWDVRLNDKPDGGSSYADPSAVVVSAGDKAYVLRYTRNQIAVIDPSEVADGGAPTKVIDLSSFVQPGDTDGILEMTAGLYVPSKKLVYVLLANIDRNAVSSDGWTILCADTAATVIAIDVDTDKVVSLTGGREDGALELSGYSPTFTGLTYDPIADRLLIVSGGCNLSGEGDEEVGPLVRRGIEELSLFTGASNTLLDASDLGFPGSFAYVDGHRAAVQFDGITYVWDPTQPYLGAAVDSAPESFVYDGKANLFGLRTRYGDDGGVAGLDILSVRIADGQVTVLGSDPFSLPSGFVGGIDVWPPRTR